MRDRFNTFALQFKKRRSVKQKRRFVSFLFDYMDTLGYPLKMHQFQHQNKKGNNIIVGELEKARTVYLVDYDTRELIYNNDYRYYPFDENFNMRILQSNLTKGFFIASGILVLCILLVMNVNNLSGILRYLSYLCIMLTAFLSVIFGRGISSPYNFKKSASIFMLCELAKSKKEKECYVFLDLSLYTGLGKYYFLQDYDLRGKTLIYIDNAACGDKTVLATSDKNKKSELEENSLFAATVLLEMPVAQEKGFRYIYLSLGIIDESNTFCIDRIGTRSDSDFNENDYQRLISAIEVVQKNI